jgi:creatinine amidohydrolase
MGTSWLADAVPETCWAHQTWTDFAALAQPEYAVVVLPVHGFADHGADRPLDIEESLGSALLRTAVEQAKARFVVRVLPPLRFAIAAKAGGFFGLDFDTAGDLMHAIAAGVKAAGFQKLVFFNTSPVNEPFVAAAALEARVGHGLRTYVIQASSLGLDPSRQRAADLGCLAQHLAGLLEEIRLHLAPPLASVTRPVAARLAPAEFPVFRSRYLPALSSAQLAALPATANLLTILPTAAIEQHGPHLPVGVDAILGHALLDAALSRLPPDAPVLIAPPVTYGASNEHLGFPGTITVSPRTLRRVVLAIAAQLRALGLRRLAVFNTHGGNSAVLALVVREIQETLGLDAFLLRHGYQPDVSGQEAAWGFHADEWETALMLACAPELVRMDRAVGEYSARRDDPGELRPEHAAATYAWMTRDISHSGIMGDPTRATPANGRRWLAAAAERLAAKISPGLNA